MPTYIGENKIVDRYLGDKFLEAAYIGDEKVYDPYTEITGYLPMIFKSRATVALKNYRIHGTADGAGVETENLWDGVFPKYVINATRYRQISVPNGVYTLWTDAPKPNNLAIMFIMSGYATSGANTSANGVWDGSPRTVTIEDGYITFAMHPYSAYDPREYKVMLVSGSTAPASYIPHGYKLPLTVESGETENLFDIIQYLTKREASYVYVNGYYCFKKDASKFYYNQEDVSDYKNKYLLLENNIELTNVALFKIELLNEDSEIIKSTSSNTESSILLIPENAKYLRLNWSSSSGEDIAIRISITEFSPDHYIPHRYTSDIPIYIGSTKLGAEEYVDYGEQKVYKRTDNLLDKAFAAEYSISSAGYPVMYQSVNRCATLEPIDVSDINNVTFSFVNNSASDKKRFIYSLFNGSALVARVSDNYSGDTIDVSQGDTLYLCVYSSFSSVDAAKTITNTMLNAGTTPLPYAPYLQPTDPPVPLPPIQTYKGENTLSSAETLGEVTVKGRIREEPLKIYGWHVDPSISDPAQAVTYLADAVDKTPAGMRSGATSTLELEQGGIIVDEQTGATIKNPTILSTRVRTTQLNVPIPWTRQLTLNCSNTRIRYLITWLDDDDVEVGTHQWDSETTTYNAPDDATSFNVLFMLDNGDSLTPSSVGTATYSYETAFSYGDWANAFFMPKPCMLRSNGTVAYYLDPNDYSKKLDGTASDVANAAFDGNAMMEWPLIWYKFEAGTADGEVNFYCSNKKADNSYKCWCNIDSENEITKHFYTSIYNGTGTSKLRSLSGVQLTSSSGCGNTTVSDEVSAAMANNTTSDVEWYTEVYSDRTLISALLILIGKTLNDKGSFGNGILDGSIAAKEAYVTGSLDAAGLFYGDVTSQTAPVKVFGMENWYGCVWHRVAGLSAGTGSTYQYKLTYGTADGSTAVGYNASANGYISSSVTRPTNYNKQGLIVKMAAGVHGLLPSAIGADPNSTYYCSLLFSDSGNYAVYGGNAVSSIGGGSQCLGVGGSSGAAWWGYAASLSCKPVKK